MSWPHQIGNDLSEWTRKQPEPSYRLELERHNWRSMLEQAKSQLI